MAARSLSMAAYRALARRGAARTHRSDIARPNGQVVFVFVGHSLEIPAVQDLADRVIQQRPDTSVLACVPSDVSATDIPVQTHENIIWVAAPDEHPKAVEAFLNHWQPDLALWIWGGLRPILIDDMARRDIQQHLVCADHTGFEGQRERWLPELTRGLMGHFQSVSARDTKALTELVRLGAQRNRIDCPYNLQATGRLLPYQPSDLDDLSTHLSGRPIWLAAQVTSDESRVVLHAHQTAMRNSHRMLLILYPAHGCDIAALKQDIDDRGLTYVVWSEGDFPEETTQVLIADIWGELGLWYRMATVSFLGTSLRAGSQGCDPMEAAALGTAVLYGPNVGAFLNSYTRLANVGAARIVNNAQSLSNAVSRLIVPYQAATMAHAGWDVVSEGADVMDQLIALVQDSLDEQLANSGSPS